MNKNTSFAEIIESSLISWRARSWKWDYAPAFGSLVELQNGNTRLFGLVHQVELGSEDPSRQPYAYGKTESELMAEQPQIFEFLMTSFVIAPIGFSEHNVIYYQLPPIPPKIHTFVSYVSNEQETLFFSDAAFLHTLFGIASQINHLDELLLAVLKNISKKNVPKQVLHNFIETFSQLVQNDFARVRLFCQRVQKNLGDSYVQRD